MMHTCRLSVTVTLAVSGALGSVLVLAACTLPTTSRPRPQAPVRVNTAAADQRITQLDFGRHARFALCAEPACPSVTRKTLAVTASTFALPAPDDQQSAPTTKATPAIEAKPAPAPDRIAPPRKLTLHFATDSAALTAAHKSLLRGAIAELRRTDRIVIVGRTDDLGSEGRNQSLALARALAIRDHLLDLAPDLPARIAIDAKGRCCYAAPNETANGRAQNRRVELVFTLPITVTS